MADYHSTAVIQPDLPLAGVSPLERLLLDAMIQTEINGEGLYCFFEQSYTSDVELNIGDLRKAVAASVGFESQLRPAIDLWLAKIADEGEDAYAVLDFDAHLDELAYTVILQDVVRRSPALTYVTVCGAHTCTKMRIDGFGGFAAFITANVIRWISTDTWLEAQFADLGIEG
ncbi:hypothetical protein [Asticcacaulis sp. W401b]|uniref:hypothetical protein n=1 Tax=Asticcacaulis sp. W401b TaxID=3388666 RepID=UPI00397099EC